MALEPRIKRWKSIHQKPVGGHGVQILDDRQGAVYLNEVIGCLIDCHRLIAYSNHLVQREVKASFYDTVRFFQRKPYRGSQVIKDYLTVISVAFRLWWKVQRKNCEGLAFKAISLGERAQDRGLFPRAYGIPFGLCRALI
jgi:hypothetical protein